MADDDKVVTKKTPVKKSVTKKTAAVTKKTAVHRADAEAPTTKKTIAKKTSVGAAPAMKKTVTKKVAPSAPRPLADRPVTLQPVAEVNEAERQKMIADAAYYRAEKRNFAPGYEHEDWLAAEAEVDAILRKRAG